MLIAIFYVIVVISIGEALRKARNLPSTFTRKIIHMFAGFSVYTVPFYPHLWPATLVALLFTILVYLSGPRTPIKRLRGWFEVMAREEDVLAGHILGPFYYCVSITVVTGVLTFGAFLGYLPAAYYLMAGIAITIMMWGDGVGDLIGRRWGKHKYEIVKGAQRSLEGSLGVFVFGFIGALVAIMFFGVLVPQVPWNRVVAWECSLDIFSIIMLSLIAAALGTLIEAISPRGFDNITIPFILTPVLIALGEIMGVF